MTQHFINDTIASGQTLTSITFSTSDSLTVDGGGTASAMVFVSGGVEYVSSGGATYFDTISSGGFENLSSGAIDYNEQVISGGQVSGPGELVNASVGGVVSLVSFGGAFNEAVNGSAASTVITPGGAVEFLDEEVNGLLVSGASASATADGGSDIANLVVESGGAVFVIDDSLVGPATVRNGGVLDVEAGIVGAIAVSSGGLEQVQGANAADDGTTLAFGATESVWNGASVVDTIDGGAEFVFDNGRTNGAQVLGGGALTVGVAGVDANALVSSGGVEVVSSGGADSVTNVLAGGLLVLVAGASLIGDVVSTGATLELLSMTVSAGQSFLAPGTALDFAWNSSGVLAEAGAYLAIDSAIVASGGVLSLTAGAVTGGAVVSAGGELLGPGELSGDASPSYDFGLVSGIALGDAGGDGGLIVGAGGVASSVRAAGVADQIVVASGGRAVKLEELGGLDTMVVERGGFTLSGVIHAGDDVVFGSAQGTHLADGGVEYVESGGSATDDVISAGGVQWLSAGGHARQTTVTSDGAVIDDGVAIWSGPANADFAGELVGSGELVEDGPGTLALSGVATDFTGDAVISGGTVALAAATGLGGGDVIFAATTARRTLQIAAADRPASGATLTTPLVDFDSTSAYLDLAGVAFVSGAKATLGGETLTLADGAYKAAFKLAGTGASKYSVFTDGAGGTEIRAAIGSTAVAFVAAMATLEPADAAPTWLAHDSRVHDAGTLAAVRPSQA